MDQELDVRLYGRHEDGGVAMLVTYSAKYFDGNVPIPGDTIISCHGCGELNFYRVLDRYFIAHDYFDRGWALLVEKIETSPDLAEMGRQWAEDTKFFAEPEDNGSDELETLSASVEKLDYASRDPEYWTFERKEILRKEREARLAAMRAEVT